MHLKYKECKCKCFTLRIQEGMPLSMDGKIKHPWTSNMVGWLCLCQVWIVQIALERDQLWKVNTNRGSYKN